MSDTRPLVLLGTYTRNDNGSKGIYACRQDPETGALEIVGHGPEIQGPSFLAVHPSKQWLYCCNSLSEFRGKPAGACSALTLDASTGAMSLINQVSTESPGPCHINLDRTGKMAMATNYGGGSIVAFKVQGDGSLSDATYFEQYHGSSCHEQRQSAPHAHSIWPDPTNQYAFACDLGTDKVMIYKMDQEAGKLVPGRQPYVRVKGGCGPRHIEFHPNGKWVYVLCEVSSAIVLFDWEPATGKLTEVDHLATLPADYDGPRNSAADIHVTPDGSLLYATNRGQDAVIMCRIDKATGKLTLLGYEPSGGDHPRNCAIDPQGKFFYTAHMNSGDIFCFRINYETGKLEPTGFKLDVPAPVCMKFV